MRSAGMILTILASLVFPGIIAITKAKLAGRRGPGLFQPLFDIVRLYRKSSVYSRTTSLVFQVAPVIYFASTLASLLFIPFGQTQGLLSFEGDFVFFAGVLTIGKFLLIIGAMDTGSGFEGMGANREALYSLLAEPAFFILMGSIALLTNHTSFHDIYSSLYLNSYLSRLVALVCIYLFGLIALIENSRLPVDDPATHLELTMVHEVMILDNSGFDLAILHLASGVKFAIYGALIANFIIPPQGILIGQLGLFLLVQIVFALCIGLLESFRPRNKMAKNPQWILTLSAISLIGFMTAMIITHNFILN